jgi:hypothetical protein
LFLRCHTALRNTRKSTEHNLDLAFNSLDARREACVAYIKSQAPRMPPPRPRVAQLDCLRGSEREIPTTKRRKAHKACPEDRQGTTLVLVARHEILMFPFERIRDVDRPAGRSEPSFYGSWLDMAESKLGVLGSLDPRVRKLLGSSPKKAGRRTEVQREAH